MNIRSAIFVTIAFLLSLGGDRAIAQNPARLANISTRMQVLTGDDVMIGGFVIGGASNKTVAIVATGPSLAAFGIANPLADPTMSLVRSSDQAVLATNDNWQSAGNAAQLQAAGFAPSNALESAILVNLAPGAYTVIVRGVADGTGVAVVAVYEVDALNTPLVNISTRGRVLTGNDVMIGGFVIAGPAPQAVAIVATGPSLAASGIASPLANPTLTVVRSSDQAVIASNDDWQAHANAGYLQAAGLAPTNALESAVYTILPPGAYTAIVSGAGNSTGVAVLGVFATAPPAETQPPQVLGVSPGNTAMFMPVDIPVVVTFTEPMNPAFMTPATFTLIGPDGPVAATVSVSGNTATLDPTGPLATESWFTGKVTTRARDLAGNALATDFNFTFHTRVDEPPPIVAGCPAPEASAQIRRLVWGQTPTILKRESGAITVYRIPQSQIGKASVSFVQGQTAFTPGSPLTEITVSRCPGVIEPGLHPSCRQATSSTLYNSQTAFNRLPSGYSNQDQLAGQGCLAPDTEQHYVNVRWTFQECNNSEGCGFSLQWVEGGS